MDCCAQRASVVVAVKRIQQRTVLTDECCFCRGGTGVDAEKTVAGIGTERSRLYMILILTAHKKIVVLLGPEQRLHAGYLKFQVDCMRQTFLKISECRDGIRFCI